MKGELAIFALFLCGTVFGGRLDVYWPNLPNEVQQVMYEEYQKEFDLLERFNFSLDATLEHLGVKATVLPHVYVMRDGVEIHCQQSFPVLGRRFGVVLERTTYSTLYLPVLAARWMVHGFGAVLCDQRGSGISRMDRYRYWRLDAPDAYDIMQEITYRDDSNGKIYLTGLSSMAIALCAGLLSEPPWAKAMAPTVGSANGHATTFQGGVFRTALIQNWLALLGFFLTLEEVKENEPYSEWWESITIVGNEDKCNIPGIHLAGWYDIFLNEHIDAFNTCQYVSNSPAARGKQKLFVTPHGHCVTGSYLWPNSHTTIPQDERIALFLGIEGTAVPEDIKKRLEAVQAISFYVMGPTGVVGRGNYWHTRSHWPVPTTTTYYLHEGGGLSTNLPTSNDSAVGYSYDPLNPVYAVGGNEMFLPCGPWKQDRFNRKDVLHYVSTPFAIDTAIIGNVSAVLYVSTDALDTDFTVKVLDLYPNGDAYNLVDGIFRLKWRNDPRVPVDARPNEVYEIKLNLWKTAYIMNAGHSLQVDVSSSNHPRFEKNLNNGKLLVEGGLPVTAFNTIYQNRNRPSHVNIPLVNVNEIPENMQP